MHVLTETFEPFSKTCTSFCKDWHVGFANPRQTYIHAFVNFESLCDVGHEFVVLLPLRKGLMKARQSLVLLVM